MARPEPRGPAPVPHRRPLFERRDFQKLVEPLRSGCLAGGPQVAAFERLLAQATGAREAVAVCSRGAALRLTLLALGVGRGQEVLVPAFGDSVLASAAELCGARPLFGDIDPETLTLDPGEVRLRATPLTTLVATSHPADLSALGESCRAKRLPLVIDLGEEVGPWQGAVAACLDLGAGGCLGCGGGAVLTEDPDLAGALRLMRAGGSGPGDGPLAPEPVLPGHGLEMSELHAALGVAQVEKLPLVLAERDEIGRRYEELLARAGWLRWPASGQGPGLCLVREGGFAGLEEAGRFRDGLLRELHGQGIGCRQPGRCLPAAGYWQRRYGLPAEGFPQALAAERLAVSLPLYVGLSLGEQQRVVRELDLARERVLAAGAERAAQPEEAPEEAEAGVHV